MCNRIRPYYHLNHPFHGVDLDVQDIPKEGEGAKIFEVEDGELLAPYQLDRHYRVDEDGWTRWQGRYDSGAAFCFFLTYEEARKWLDRKQEEGGLPTIETWVVKKIRYRGGQVSRFELDRAIRTRIALCKEFQIIED